MVHSPDSLLAWCHGGLCVLQVEIQVKDLATAEQQLRLELAEQRRHSSSGGSCISLPCMNPTPRY